MTPCKTIAALMTGLVLALTVCTQTVWCQAQSYPTRQLTYLIPFDPGGQSDVEARRQQPHLSRILGQQVIIDYKVGWRRSTRLERTGEVQT